MRGRGDYLGLRPQQIACVLPGGGHTVEALARVAAEAQQRAGSLRSMQAAWQARPLTPSPQPELGHLHRVEAAWQACPPSPSPNP